MLSLPFYHVLHAIGLMCLFLGLGGMLINGYSKGAMKWHGIGLVILLVSGFGNLAKLGLMSHIPLWAILKMVLWLVLGALPMLLKRKLLASSAAIMLTLAIGAVIAYLAVFKPF